MSSSFGGSTFNSSSFDNNTDLVQQKKTSLLDKVFQKRTDLGFSSANLKDRSVEALDADTVRINPSVADKAFDPNVKPVDVRLKSNNFGESFNAYETSHGNENDPEVAARLQKQRDTIDNELLHGWFNPATNQDVYDRGNAGKQVLANKLKQVNEGKTGLDFALGERDMYGRPLGDMKLSNENNSVIDSMNTPEINSAYNTPYNFAKQNKDTATLGQAVDDTGRLALTGIEGVGSALGYGLEKTGIAPELGRQIQDEHFKHDEMLRSHLSDPVKKASQEPLLDANNDLNPNFGLTSLATNVIPSIPGSVVMGGAGGVLAKGLGTAAKAALGAESTASKLITNGLGFGTSEGVFSAAQNADQWGQEQRQKPIEEFKNSPVWNETLAKNKGNEEATKEDLINQGQSDIFKDTAITTGALSGLPGMAGGMYGKLFDAATSGAKITAKGAFINALKGMSEEAAQEYPQSLFERRTTNQATKDYIDPNQDVSEGQWNDAAIGGLSGFAMGTGGAIGHIASIDRTKTPVDTQTPIEETIVQPEANLKPSIADYEASVDNITDDIRQEVINQGIKDYPIDGTLPEKIQMASAISKARDTLESPEHDEILKQLNAEIQLQNFAKGMPNFNDVISDPNTSIEDIQDNLITGTTDSTSTNTGSLFNDIGRTKDADTLNILKDISIAKQKEYADSNTVNDPYVLATTGIETKNLSKESSEVFSAITRGESNDLNQDLLLLSSHVKDIKGTEEQKNTGISALTKTISKVYSDKVDITPATERTVKQALTTINGLVTNKGTITIEPSDTLEDIHRKILPTFGSTIIENNSNDEKAKAIVALNNAVKTSRDKLNDKSIEQVSDEIISGGGEKFSAKQHLTIIATLLTNDVPKEIINKQVAKFKVWADFHKAKGTLALELANAPESKRAEIELRLKELQGQDGFKGFKYQSIIYPTSGTSKANKKGITKLANEIFNESIFLQTMADEAQRTVDNWGSINAEEIQPKLNQEQKLLDNGKSTESILQTDEDAPDSTNVNIEQIVKDYLDKTFKNVNPKLAKALSDIIKTNTDNTNLELDVEKFLHGFNKGIGLERDPMYKKGLETRNKYQGSKLQSLDKISKPKKVKANYVDTHTLLEVIAYHGGITRESLSNNYDKKTRWIKEANSKAKVKPGRALHDMLEQLQADGFVGLEGISDNEFEDILENERTNPQIRTEKGNNFFEKAKLQSQFDDETLQYELRIAQVLEDLNGTPWLLEVLNKLGNKEDIDLDYYQDLINENNSRTEETSRTGSTEEVSTEATSTVVESSTSNETSKPEEDITSEDKTSVIEDLGASDKSFEDDVLFAESQWLKPNISKLQTIVKNHKGTIKELLIILKTQKEASPLRTELINLLLKSKVINKFKINFEDKPPEWDSPTASARTEYTEGNQTITLYSKAFTSDNLAMEVILHEIVHAATKQAIKDNPILTKELQILLDKLNSMELSIEEQGNITRINTANSPLDELMAYGLTRTVTLKLLARTKLSDRSFFTSFLKAVKKIFQLPDTENTALIKLFSLAETAIDENIETEFEVPPKQEFTPEYQNEIKEFKLANVAKLKKGILSLKPVKRTIPNPITQMFSFDKVKDSLFGKYPKLFDNLFKLPEFTVKTKDGLKAFETLKTEESKFQEAFKKSYAEKPFEDDPLIVLANQNVSQGKFDPNIVSAMFIGSIDWLMNKGSDTLFNFEKDIQSILSMDENTIPQNEISNALSELGSVRAMVATGLGNNIFNLMKFTASKTYPENEIAKLKLSLGLHALNTLNNMGYVTYSAVENSSFDKFKQNEVVNPEVKHNLSEKDLQDQSVVFVRIASDIEDKKSVIEYDLKQVLDILKAGSKEITAMFESAYEKELPRTKKPNKASVLASLGFNEEKGKKATGLHTTQEINDERIDALTKYVQTSHTLDTPTMKLYLAMNEDARAEMELGSDFQEQKQQSKERSFRGKVLSYEKEKEALEKLLELSEQGSKPLYFMSTFWNQGRIGGIGVGHPQNNKWIRNLSSPKNYFVKIKPSDEFAVEQFKLAVLEAFGIAAKSLTKEQIDPEFQKILTANKEAIKQINLQKEGKEFNQRTIINAVHKGKEKAHTLNGLVALSMYSPTEEFETNIGREVDGITNGVLIGLVLLAGVDNFERMKDVLAAAGLFEDPTMDYATWKNSIESKEDNYEQIARVFAESLNKADQTPQLLAIKHFIGDLLVEDKVTKQGRNFAKPILLLTMFGKSTDKLANSVGDTVIETFYGELEKLQRDTELDWEDKVAKLDVLKKQIETILNKPLQGNEYVEGKVIREEDNKALLVDLTMNNLLEFSLTQQDANSIIATVNHLFQPMIEEAINYNFGVTIDNRKILNDAYFVVGETFKLGLKKELDTFKIERGREPSAEEMDKIIADLIKIQPRSPTKNSESLEQDLQLWNSERSSNHTAAYRTQTGWNSKTGKLKYTVTDIDGEVHIEEIDLPKSTTAHALSLFINSLGVGVTIANIHNRDSNVMIDMMKSKFKGLAVHDAFIFNLLEAVEGSKLLNSSLIDSLNSFDVFQGAVDNLERVQEYLKANPDIANELNASFTSPTEGLFSKQRFYTKDKKTKEITPYYNNLDNFVNRLKANQETLATQRQEQIWDHIPKGGVKQYGGQDSYEFIEETKTKPSESNKEEVTHLVITPIQVADKKATIKGKLANKFIGFAEGINNSSTGEYAKQAGDKANTGEYTSDDIIFVSVPGKRGNAEVRKVQQTKTIKEAIKALEAGATLLTDNEKYVTSSEYNEGELRLRNNLLHKGYKYSEITSEGQVIGKWFKEEVKPSTTQINEDSKLGSTPNAEDLFTDKADLIKDVTAENIVSEFDSIPKGEDEVHNKFLRNFVSQVIAPVVEATELLLFSKATYTYGQYSAELKKVAINLGQALQEQYSPFKMSAQEVFAHEFAHAVTWAAYQMPKNGILKRKIDSLFYNVRREFNKAKTLDSSLAKWDYVFNNTDPIKVDNAPNSLNEVTTTSYDRGIQEFIAFGTTSKEFRDLIKRLQPKQLNVNQVYEGTGSDVIKEASWLETITNVFKRVLDSFMRIAKGKDYLEPLTQFDTTVRLILAANTDKPFINITAITDKVEAEVARKINDGFKKGLKIIAKGRKSKIQFIRSAAKLADAIPNIGGFQSNQVVRQTLKLITNPTARQFALDLVKDIADVNENSKPITNTTIQQKTADAERNSKTDSDENAWSKFVTLNHEQDIALKNLLRGDITTLVDEFGLDKTIELLKNKVVRDREGKAIANQITNLKSKAYNLAHLMVHGSNRYSGMTEHNAALIAKAGRNIPQDMYQKDMDLVSKLASIYAIGLQDQNQLDLMIKELETNPEGMSKIFNIHKANKLQELSEVSPLTIIAGKLNTTLDPNKTIFLGTKEDEKALKEWNAKVIGKLERDPNDPLTIEGILYLVDVKMQNDWDAKAMATTDINPGSSNFQSGIVKTDRFKAAENREKAALKDNITKTKNTIFTKNNSNVSRVAIHNAQGKIINYEYILDRATQEKYLNPRINVLRDLSAQKNGTTYRAKAYELNHKLVDALHNYWKKLGHAARKDMVWVGTEGEYKDLYNMIPTETKAYITKVFGTENGFYMAQEEIREVFGYRKHSITNWIQPIQADELKKTIGNMIYEQAKRFGLNQANLKALETMWIEGISIAKDTIVVKSGIVSAANESSNFMTAKLAGVPVGFYYKNKISAMKAEQEYRRDSHAYMTHLSNAYADPNYITKEIAQEMSILESAISTNEMSYLHDEGLASTVAEEGSYKDKHQTMLFNKTERARNIFDKLPKIVKDTLKVASISEGTKVYKLLDEIAQMGDITSRHVLIKWEEDKARQQGIDFDKTKAIDLAKFLFIQYHTVTNDLVQYGNDIGLLMFSKFAVKTLKVLTYMIGQHPARLIALGLFEEMFATTEWIWHTNMNKLTNPISAMLATIDASPLVNLTLTPPAYMPKKVFGALDALLPI